MNINYPERIICLTEESVEWLYLLGQQHRIVGISQFVERPANARDNHPVITSFIKSNYKKINELKPDLILGYSDIQKDIARDLIEMGFNVWISNHRSLDQVLEYLLSLGTLVNCRSEALEKIEAYQDKIKQIQGKVNNRSRVYIEEWDEPMISGIQYFSEVVDICGGDNIFKDLAQGFLAKERFIDSNQVIAHDPEKILACWCGKKVNIDSILNRDGWGDVSAIKTRSIYELDPAVFLQPGPALFEDGLDLMYKLLHE